MTKSRQKFKKEYLKLYLEFRKAVVLNSGFSKATRIYNGLLHDFLMDCQRKRFLPSKEYVSDRCISLSTESERVDYSGDSSSDILSLVRIDEAIQSMSFFPAMMLKGGDDKEGKWLYYYLEVFGIIPLEGLNDTEIGFLEEAFDRKAMRDESQMDVKIMSLKASDRISEELQDKVNDVCLRVARDHFSKYSERNGHSGCFKYPLFQRIKDYFTKLEV